MASPVPSEVKQAVAFVYVARDEGQIVPNGTCFFLGKPKTGDPNKYFVYLVTAGHVLKRNNTGPLFDRIFVRLNRKDGGVEAIELRIVGPGSTISVFQHTDPTVDLAVIPFLPDQARFEFKFLPEDFLAGAEDIRQLGIAEGTEVFFTGLFLQSLPSSRNVPIVRFGRVALAPGEPVVWDGTARDLLLIESFSYGGNSGSPVFFYLGSDRRPGVLTVGPPVVRLAGVMMGAYQDVKPIGVVQSAPIPVATSNIGIAAVVPAGRLKELLLSPPLKVSRGEK